LKQLVATVGEDAFQAGMRAYFRDFSFKNARLSDFLAAVSLGSGVDLAPWSAAWLETPGVNTLAMVGGTDGWRLEQSAAEEYPTLRPHTVRIGFTTEADGVLSTVAVPAIIDSESIGIEAPVNDPVFVFPNYDDLGYAKVHLDEASLHFATSRVNDIDDPLLRQMTWATLWEMVRDQEFSSAAYLSMVNEKGPTETNIHSIRLMTNTASTATSRFTPEADITVAETSFVAAGLKALEVAPRGDDRVLWLRAMIANASSPADLGTMAEILDGTYGADVAVDQNMRWNLATRWSAFGLEGWEDRARLELERDHSDRGLRNMVSIEVAQPNVDAKSRAWKKIHGDGYGSLYMDLAAMRGFNWRHQRELLEPYVEMFFEGLPSVFAQHGHEYADRYFDVFFPWYRIDDEVRNRIATMLSTIKGPPMLVRQLREAADQLERAMRCRAVAQAG
ncbi:MAG: aminopeptidase N, partial [Acidimicrobiia bacterium]|nr:aminopeptidase N [Acidimicrobiia bacterium]